MRHSCVMLTEYDIEKFDLRYLLDIERLQQIQEEFSAETGLGMITVDSMGVPVTQPSRFSSLCQVLRQDPEFRKRCFLCDAHGGFQSALQNRPFIYRCHAGLVDFSVSIMAGRQYLGAIMAGQVLLRDGLDQLGHIMGSSELTASFDSDQLDEYFSRIQVTPVDKLEHAARQIVDLANQALGDAGAVLRISAADETEPTLVPLRKPQSGDCALIPSVASDIDIHAALDSQSWLKNLRSANIGANLDLLNRYLDALLPRWSQKVPVAKLGPFEDLMIGIAAREGQGVSREISGKVIAHRNRHKSPLNRYAAQVYFERLLTTLHDQVEPHLSPGERSIETLLNEIEKDCTAFLDVGTAAEFLMWSDSHFSHQFKKRVGVSFKQYVNSKRVERAKFLLVHTDLPVLRIASTLKYRPLNYFTRVFKREVGISPTQFRQAAINEEAQQ